MAKNRKIQKKCILMMKKQKTPLYKGVIDEW